LAALIRVGGSAQPRAKATDILLYARNEAQYIQSRPQVVCGGGSWWPCWPIHAACIFQCISAQHWASAGMTATRCILLSRN